MPQYVETDGKVGGGGRCKGSCPRQRVQGPLLSRQDGAINQLTSPVLREQPVEFFYPKPFRRALRQPFRRHSAHSLLRSDSRPLRYRSANAHFLLLTFMERPRRTAAVPVFTASSSVSLRHRPDGRVREPLSQ
jgi:hypothetical protein